MLKSEIVNALLVLGILGEAKLLAEQGISARVVTRRVIACPVERMGVNDEFGHFGSARALLEQFGLCARHIVEIVNR